MSENSQLPVDNSPDSLTAKPRSRLRRISCGIGLVIWIIMLLFPCIAIALVAQGEIAIQLGDVPGQSFRVWLIQDATERGLGIARPSLHTDENSNTCLQTDTSFLMWMGKGDTTSFCECYAHEVDNWKLVRSAQGKCNP
ncbi:MAG: hypothetical protein GC179_18055 [Anaerolineaceae bacterium]|nr:hypothetical protein [Anaerolineaceae bacterium]